MYSEMCSSHRTVALLDFFSDFLLVFLVEKSTGLNYTFLHRGFMSEDDADHKGSN